MLKRIGLHAQSLLSILSSTIHAVGGTMWSFKMKENPRNNNEWNICTTCEYNEKMFAASTWICYTKCDIWYHLLFGIMEYYTQYCISHILPTIFKLVN